MNKSRVLRAVLVLGSFLFLTACSEEFVGNLNQRDTLDAELLLERAGIEVVATRGEDGRYTLSGDAGDRAQALEILSAQGLPRNEHATVADVFPGGGFLVTPFEQKVRMRYAVEEQLSETLSALEGVAEARVHIVLAEDNGRGLTKEKARASVLLKYRPGADVPAIETRSRALVVNGVQGLAYEDISVVASPWQFGEALSQGSEPAASPVDGETGSEDQMSVTSYFSLHNVLISFGVLLAVCAGALLLPRRKEN